jgi:hypothetical protein
MATTTKHATDKGTTAKSLTDPMAGARAAG